MNWIEAAKSGHVRNVILLLILVAVGAQRLMQIWEHPPTMDEQIIEVHGEIEDVKSNQTYFLDVSGALLREASFDRCQKAERANGATFEQAQMTCEREHPAMPTPKAPNPKTRQR